MDALMLLVGLEMLHIYSVWSFQTLWKKYDNTGYKQRNMYYTSQLKARSQLGFAELEYSDIAEATGYE